MEEAIGIIREKERVGEKVYQRDKDNAERRRQRNRQTETNRR